jgi:hypothetical protein
VVYVAGALDAHRLARRVKEFAGSQDSSRSP